MTLRLPRENPCAPNSSSAASIIAARRAGSTRAHVTVGITPPCVNDHWSSYCGLRHSQGKPYVVRPRANTCRRTLSSRSVGVRRALTSMASVAALVNCAPARADAPPTPGIKINDETSFCTSAFTAQGNDGNYYLMTSAHCDAHDGSLWTYGDDQAPLGKIAKGEYDENPNTGTQTKDAALIQLQPGVGVPSDDIARKYPVRD